VMMTTRLPRATRCFAACAGNAVLDQAIQRVFVFMAWPRIPPAFPGLPQEFPYDFCYPWIKGMETGNWQRREIPKGDLYRLLAGSSLRNISMTAPRPLQGLDVLPPV